MEPGFKTSLADCRVGLIGLGLMGGSLALALHDQCAALCGADLNPAIVAQACERGIINGPLDLTGDQVDLLILATPVSAILDWLDRIPAIFSGHFHLLDLGSTKAQITDRMQRLPDRISPLGGHPMCGKESSGLAMADRALYHSCLFALTPLAPTQPSTLQVAQELIDALSARSVILTPAQHDHIAAIISHLPYLLALTLTETVSREADPATWDMAASGFRDTSRLAASDVTMMLDIIRSNQAEVIKALGTAQTVMQDLRELIVNEDWPTLRGRLESMQAKRKWWDNLRRKDEPEASGAQAT